MEIIVRPFISLMALDSELEHFENDIYYTVTLTMVSWDRCYRAYRLSGIQFPEKMRKWLTHMLGIKPDIQLFLSSFADAIFLQRNISPSEN